MSFFHRNQSQQQQQQQQPLGETTAVDGSAAWHDFANDGLSPTTTANGFLHPKSSSNNIISSNWAQERSSQQTDLENEVGGQMHSRGCCQSTLIFLIKGLHIFNVTLGMVMLVYGILVQQHGKQQHQQRQLARYLQYFMVESSSSSSSLSSIQHSNEDQDAVMDMKADYQQPQPEVDKEEDQASQQQQQAMAAVLFCLLLGSIQLLTSGVGLFSLFLHNIMKWGYIISAWAGPYFTLLYLSMLIALLFDSDGFIMYLEEHAQVMYLSSNVIENATKIFLPVAYTLLAVLGILESMRYCVLMNMYNELVAREEADAYVPRSPALSQSRSSSTPRSGSRDRVSANDTLTQALLQDGIDAETVRSNTSVDPNWWEK